jgi:erythromycin esterase-like protein
MTDAELVREIAQPLTGSSDDYDALLTLIGNARFVLIGEARHGTHEFYSERATITKRLIDETQAVEPLERTSIWEEGELPETYPFKVQ